MKVNKYIQSLINDNKLNLSVQADQWKFGKNPFIISGPCSVESEEMIVDWSLKMKELGVDALRGGAYKPCTYPITEAIGDWKEGLREDGLRFLLTAKIIFTEYFFFKEIKYLENCSISPIPCSEII